MYLPMPFASPTSRKHVPGPVTFVLLFNKTMAFQTTCIMEILRIYMIINNTHLKIRNFKIDEVKT